VTRQNLGSGFLIEGGRILTNHHVIPDVGTAEKAYIEFGYEENLDGTLRTACRFELDADPAAFRADAKLDYCVVKVKERSAEPFLKAWGVLPLELDARNTPKVGEHVTIIQHPAGGPKQIAVTANQVVNIFDHRLQYTTDTMPGSSGSPVFNDAWKVVALHHAGGNMLCNAKGDRMFANEGILIGHIWAAIGAA